MRSPQLQYELGETLADCGGVELDLRIGGLKALAPGLLRGDRTPSVLLVEIDVQDGEDMAVLGQLSAEASRCTSPSWPRPAIWVRRPCGVCCATASPT